MSDAISRVISLYSGVGGLDFGFEAAGFETAVALEMDGAACRNLRTNRTWPVLEGDINQFTSAEILEAGSLSAGSADVLIGGPPCQPFSKSGYWHSGDAKRLDDPRADTLDAYLRVLRDTRPKVFLLENVPGLAYKGKSEGLDRILETLEAINHETGTRYAPCWDVINAADFGVPQMRERFVMVAARDGARFAFPKPTHGEGRHRYHSCWDALGDLPEQPNEPNLKMTGKWAALLPTIPEGQNYLWHTERGGGEPLFGWRRRYWSFLLKLAKDRPSWTIQAQPGSATGPFHWDNRRLSSRELCRLQTFPDTVTVTGSRQDIQRLIGNAVPSLLAEVLAHEIATQLLGMALPAPRPTLEPPSRTTPPPRPAIERIPAQYAQLRGEHSAHPGNGQGYGAARRQRAHAT
ncbi:MAG: DNA cytosine methyltransferase [Pseudomonadota bacterium]